ncbi:MAG: pentapeptide repeat-containing protein [Nostoc sp.]|uniref:pentapeptide repeat-containing protein n=1 Tax=Nostoc sp. TaxID=1180 RepID=UPI002FFC65C8
MEKITAEDLLRRYAAGCRDFQRILIEYADLSGVELQNIDLGHAKFRYVNLSSTNLRSCNLIGSEFCYCNLRNANIESCFFECAWFLDCDLGGINTRICELTSTRFIRVNLQDAKLSGSGEEPCEFWDVIRPDGKFIPGFTYVIYPAPSPDKVNGEDIPF